MTDERIKELINRIREEIKKAPKMSDKEYLILKERLSEDEAEYVIKNPCLAGHTNECRHYLENKNCLGCTDLNGFFLIKTSGVARPRLTELFKRPNIQEKTVVFVKKNGD